MAYLLLTATAFFWGANAVFARLAVGEVSPMALVALRWLLVALMAGVVAGPALRREWSILRPALTRLAAMGVLGFTGFNALYYVAAHHTTAINLGILQGVLPLLIVVGARVFQGTPIRALQALGVLVGLVGVAVVVSAGSVEQLAATRFNPGDLLMLIACVLYAGYTLALRSRPSTSPLAAFAVMAFAAFVAALPLAVGEIAMGDFQAPTPRGWAVVAAIAVFPSTLGQIFYIRGVEGIGPGRAGVFTNLVPIFASGLAVWTLSEHFHAYHALALLLVFAGIACSEFANRRALDGA